MRCNILLGQEGFFVSNLPLQCDSVVLQFLHLLLQGVLVLFQYEEALGCSSGPLPAQLGKVDHLCDRHTRFS